MGSVVKNLEFALYTLPPWLYVVVLVVSSVAVAVLITVWIYRALRERWFRANLEEETRATITILEESNTRYRDDIRTYKRLLREAIGARRTAEAALKAIPDVVFLDE